MIFNGIAHKFGDNIDTDVIIPARYLSTFEPQILAGYCMTDLDREFAGKVTKGDIMVAGENFGCGSSREHAPIAIKGAGISCIIAKSFARIFMRNSINIGLPILECSRAAEEIKDKDRISVDIIKGEIKNLTTGKTYNAMPFPPFLQKIIDSGGLINSIKDKK